LDKFLTDNYSEIIIMAQKICKASPESEDVAHFAIEQFMTHERAQELVDAGRAMNFISGIIWRSFNSSTSQYHTIYRQKGKVYGLPQNYDEASYDNTYDYEQDIALEAVQGVLEDMEAASIETWFRATLLKMYMKEPNFSELARQTKIPRTSIAKAVEEAKEYIKQQLKNNNINYD